MQTETSLYAAEVEHPACASESFDRGRALLQDRDLRPAIRYFYSAERSGYDLKKCAAARWDCWMMLGEFERAWQESDLISAAGGDLNRFWDGQPWDGKRVMLRCLHGLGDTIQFIRYAPLLRKTCRSLLVQTHPQLMNFIKGVQGVDYVFTWGDHSSEERSAWDMQIEVTELPRAFRTTIPTIPAQVPYVRVPDERIEWASKWLNESGDLRIGIAWEAGPWDCLRSIALSELSSLFALESCRFYGLQKGADPEQLAKCRAVHNVECHAADIRDTAALILNLDLVITVDTMTAHLAGALGCPVWILLPGRADWRWMLDRSGTPWYPTARLFRQNSAGGWAQTIEDVGTALAEVSAKSTLLEQRRYSRVMSGGSVRSNSEVNL